MDLADVLREVERAFARTSVGLRQWDDPHPPPDRVVAEEQYSRVTDPAKWRIVGARADAWIDALSSLGLATVARDAEPNWAEPPGPVITRTDVLTPAVPGGMRILLCRSRIGDVPDAGVTIGVGRPARQVVFIPDCGCDACDSGSANEIEHFDQFLRPMVTGEFRHLVRGEAVVMQLEDGHSSAGSPGRMRFDRHDVLTHPRGWEERSGPSWLIGAP